MASHLIVNVVASARQGHRNNSSRPVDGFMTQDRPADAGHFVGQRPHRLAEAPRGLQFVDPATEAIILVYRQPHNGTCTVHQETMQIAITGLADPEQQRLSTATVLFGTRPRVTETSSTLRNAWSLPTGLEHTGYDGAEPLQALNRFVVLCVTLQRLRCKREGGILPVPYMRQASNG